MDSEQAIRRCPQHGFFRGDACSCGSRGKLVLDGVRTEKLGRLLAGALRHFPDDLGLAMSPQGWVEIPVLVDAIRTRYRWANENVIMALVRSDPKGRYEINGTRIRARYGHSVDVDLDYPENELPMLYYGTAEEEAERLLEVGLKSATQRYVHLSTTPDKAWEVGTFRTSNPKIIVVDAAGAQREGVKMMKVSESIVISDPIPPRFLSMMPAKAQK